MSERFRATVRRSVNWCVPEDSAFEWGQALNVKGEMSQDSGAGHKSSSMHNEDEVLFNEFVFFEFSYRY